MMYITDSYGSVLEWHIGTTKPPLRPSEPGRVARIQAEGEELDMIKLHFLNIPMVQNRRVHIWTGETAQFIYDNM